MFGRWMGDKIYIQRSYRSIDMTRVCVGIFIPLVILLRRHEISLTYLTLEWGNTHARAHGVNENWMLSLSVLWYLTLRLLCMPFIYNFMLSLVVSYFVSSAVWRNGRPRAMYLLVFCGDLWDDCIKTCSSTDSSSRSLFICKHVFYTRAVQQFI